MTKTRVAAAPTTAWRNRITGAGEEAPDQLLANPRNWRLHPRNQQAALAGSLDAGRRWVQQVMVNRQTGFVVDGHARVDRSADPRAGAGNTRQTGWAMTRT
jgi:hypothetical protein